MRNRYRQILVGIAVVLLSPGCGRSQNGGAQAPPPAAAAVAPPPATKMEAFKPRAGSVVIFGYDELGGAAGVSVDVRELRDDKGASVRGLQVQVTESEYRKERAFVDADEIPELLKGFDALLEVKANPTQFKNFEVRYTTRGNLQLTAFNDSRGALSYSVKGGQVVGASAFLNAANMQRLRGLFDSALQKLTALGLPPR